MTINDLLRTSQKVSELMPLPDDIKRLSQTNKLSSLEDFTRDQTENADMILEGDLI